jgi:hypothetical protein
MLDLHFLGSPVRSIGDISEKTKTQKKLLCKIKFVKNILVLQLYLLSQFIYGYVKWPKDGSTTTKNHDL